MHRMSQLSSLESVENDFQSFLLTGNADIERRVVGTARVPIATRLAIYGNAYRSRLAETLEIHYPALAAFLGAQEFDALCSAYIDAHDSTFASIRFYGGELAAFISAHLQHQSAPLLAELAQWEWAMNAVFDAADAEPVEVQALAEVAPEAWAGLTFELHPSLRRLDFEWNAPQLWKAVTGATAAPDAAKVHEAVAWLLWRRDLQIYFRPLDRAEAQALDAVGNGQSFGELCVALCADTSDTEAPAIAAGYLRGWVESGMIIGTRPGEE
jgi:hypothetical protein